MIRVENAIELILNNTTFLEKYRISLSKGLTHYLSEDVISPIHMPPFRQSAMDGYALHLGEDNQDIYQLIGEIKAGDSYRPKLKKGEAVRIFTGAPVPDSANVVVMQEKVIDDGETITIKGLMKDGDNIRPLGEQIKRGEVALKKGTKLTSAAIGYLASLGISELNVYKKPKIAIVATGDELTPSGENLAYGKIYESNAIMLLSALKNLHYVDNSIYKVEDDYQKTYDLLNQIIVENDMVLVTGGISVGDYDFVGKALQDLAVEQIFYKIRQKPGKPLFYGRKGSTSIFGLPGNPAAALSCFYVYVCPALRKMSGDAMNLNILETLAESNSDYIKKGNRAQFLKAVLKGNQVTVLEGQGSSMLQTFAFANVFVYLSEEQEGITKGDMVNIIPIQN